MAIMIIRILTSIPPIAIWVGLGCLAILIVALTAVAGVWLVS